MTISKASEHDLPVAKYELLNGINNVIIFGDTVFADRQLQENMLKEHNVEIVTPNKRKSEHKQTQILGWCSFKIHFKRKQAIESFNNWIIEKTISKRHLKYVHQMV